jgi:hypothetical protein
MRPFTKLLRDKGWKAHEVAARWGMGKQRISQIAAAPTQRDWDAAAGLPERRSNVETTKRLND